MIQRTILEWKKINENINFHNLQYIGINNLDPTEFEIIGYCYMQKLPDGDSELEYDNNDDIVTHTLESTIKNNVMTNNTTCNHCNKRIKYVVIAKRIGDTETVHVFGRQCADQIGLHSLILKKLDNGQKNNQKITLRQSQQKTKLENITKILTDNPGLEDALKVNNKIINSINANFKTYATLSEKQIELVLKLAKQTIQYNKDKEKSYISGNVQDITIDKLKNQEMLISTIKVIKTPAYSGDYDETKLVLTLQHPTEGWKIYGKVLADNFMIYDQNRDKIGNPINEPKPIFNVGDKIMVTSATITKSDKDPKFGFFKRIRIKTI